VKQLQHAAARRINVWGIKPLPMTVAYGPKTRLAFGARDLMPSQMASVLIVDSYRDEAEMYAQYLQSVGATVDYVRTPEEAFARLLPQPPVVIVTDMVFQASAYDGPAFLKEIRSRPECATTSCIVLSGFPRPSDRQRARSAGADRFLVKPCAPDELRRHVDSARWAHDRRLRAPWNWPDDGPPDSERAHFEM
jgi:CheY-like chemotaxis protein